MDLELANPVYYDDEESTGDSERNFSDLEIENELYSVIHHTDFSKGIPEELKEKYDIEINDNREIIVALKTSKNENKEMPENSVESEKETENRTPERDSDNCSVQSYEINIKTKNNKRPPSDDESDSNSVELIEKDCEVISVCSDSSDRSIKIISVQYDKQKKKTQTKKMNKRNLINNRRRPTKKQLESILLSDSDDETDLMINTSGNRWGRNDYDKPELEIADVVNSDFTWKNVESPQSWTKSMRRYYNKPCERLKFFDHRKIILDLKKEKADWFVKQIDLIPNKKERIRCRNCRQVDHTVRNCPKKDLLCIMCGETGHNYNYCPARMCLNCGAKHQVFVAMCSRCRVASNSQCFRCKQRGHEARNCPDQWRQFHATTGSEIKSNCDANPNVQCSNCGRSGHLYEDCQQLFHSPYPPSSCFVNIYSNGEVNTVHKAVKPARTPEKERNFIMSNSFNGTHNQKKNNFFNNSKLFNHSTPNSSKKKKKRKKKIKTMSLSVSAN